eukprot:4677537-Ditylum_brightwellii.AAC.1
MAAAWGDEDSLGSLGSMESLQDKSGSFKSDGRSETSAVGDLLADMDELGFGDIVSEISNARNVARASVSSNDVVMLGYGSCPHSDYLTATSGGTHFKHGYL